MFMTDRRNDMARAGAQFLNLNLKFNECLMKLCLGIRMSRNVAITTHHFPPCAMNLSFSPCDMTMHDG